MAEEQTLVAIGHRIRRIREDRKLTQLQVAHKATISRSYIAQVELGSKAASFPVLLRIAKALCVSIEELLGDEAGSEYLRDLREEREQFRRVMEGVSSLAALETEGVDVADPRVRLFLRRSKNLTDEQWEELLRILESED